MFFVIHWFCEFDGECYMSLFLEGDILLLMMTNHKHIPIFLTNLQLNKISEGESKSCKILSLIMEEYFIA